MKIIIGLEKVKEILESRGIAILEEKDVENGKQLKVGDASITAYNNSNVIVQGKRKREYESILSDELDRLDANHASKILKFEPIEIKTFNGSSNKSSVSLHVTGSSTEVEHSRKKIFIVHGHDPVLQDVQLFLWKHGYEPIALKDETDGGDTIIEKLERTFSPDNGIAAAIVLATPDDRYTRISDNVPVARCRPNVELELGFVIAHLTRKRLIYLRKNVLENETFILPSDVQGIIYTPFTRINEVENKILQELRHILQSLPK